MGCDFCRMSLRCSGLYLAQYWLTSPQLLASGDGTTSAIVVGDVFIHPSAKVHRTAKVTTTYLWLCPLLIPVLSQKYMMFSSVNRLVPTSPSLQMLVLDRVSGLSAVSSLTMLRSWYVFLQKETKNKNMQSFFRDLTLQ